MTKIPLLKIQTHVGSPSSWWPSFLSFSSSIDFFDSPLHSLVLLHPWISSFNQLKVGLPYSPSIFCLYLLEIADSETLMKSLNLSFNPISLASTDPSFPAGSNPSLLLPQTLTENDVFAKNDAAMGKSGVAIGPIFSLVCTREEERWYMAAGNWCCDLGRWRQGKR